MEIAKTLRARDRTLKEYERLFQEAHKAENVEQKLELLKRNETTILASLDHELATLETRFLTYTAKRFGVPLIPFVRDNEITGDWVQSPSNGSWHLTEEAASRLRFLVRRERRERYREFLSSIAALTGLGGVIIAIFVIVLRR